MEKKINEYKIVTGSIPDSVSKEVQSLIVKGYQPLGPVSVSTTYSNINGDQRYIYAQAMVK
jgi:hypothetical protein